MRARYVVFVCLSLFCSGSIAPQRSSVPDVVDGELGTTLHSQMRQLAEKGFAGVVLIAKNGKIVLNHGYGTANREEKGDYSADTVFDIGSITKQFTAAAILKLEMQGKLSVQDKIGKYFRSVPPDKADITLHHLLTHTAGLVDVLGGDYEVVTRDELVKKALESKLQTPPGAKYDYSNLGYSLLGAVIEQVSGRSYESFLHDNLFKPAGMTKTGYSIPKWDRKNLAVGYREDGSRWGTPVDQLWSKDGPYWNLRANGGLLSTAGDLYKWHQALQGEKILSRETKDKYQAPHVAEDPEGRSHYGYGWVVQNTSRGGKLIWHNGGNPYFFADFRRYIDDDVVAILATNVKLRPLQKDLANVLQTAIAAPARIN